MYRSYNEKNKTKAAALRREMTPYERHLWYDFLSQYPVRFHRQFMCGPYILDFFCRRANLAIELDGRQHSEEEAFEYDQLRTQYLNAQNITVIRIPNTDITHNFQPTCEYIDQTVKQLMNLPSED